MSRSIEEIEEEIEDYDDLCAALEAQLEEAGLKLDQLHKELREVQFGDLAD